VERFLDFLLPVLIFASVCSIIGIGVFYERTRMIAIDDIVTPFTSRIYSHRSAWPRTQKCLIESLGKEVILAFGSNEIIENADFWCVSHGMEFKDTYNLNGGWLPEHAERLRLMIRKGADRVVSLERPMPDLVGILKPRGDKSDCNLTDDEWAQLQYIVDNCTWKTAMSMAPSRERVVLGDSHSVARFRGGSLVLRNDGLTLHGLLKRGVVQMLREAGLTGISPMKYLVIVGGNIDIRHHLMRQPEPFAAIDTMLDELRVQLRDVITSGMAQDVEITVPYPIEFEGRKLPKTGYYKGTPFFGSWAEREALRKYMTDGMVSRFGAERVKQWPSEWFELDPEKYAETYMEKPRSVHLSPAFYEWDLEENRAR